jgi:hypothetical protein
MLEGHKRTSDVAIKMIVQLGRVWVEVVLEPYHWQLAVLMLRDGEADKMLRGVLIENLGLIQAPAEVARRRRSARRKKELCHQRLNPLQLLTLAPLEEAVLHPRLYNRARAQRAMGI